MAWLERGGRPASRVRALALLACAAGGCLPAGNMPMGQHLSADRGYAIASFLPATTAGGPAHLVLAGPSYPVDVGSSEMIPAADLSLVTVPAPGAAAGGGADAHVVLQRSPDLVGCGALPCGLRTLADGRVLLRQVRGDSETVGVPLFEL